MTGAKKVGRWKMYANWYKFETSVLTMNQILFLIDFPRKRNYSQEQRTTAFFDELVYFLRASTLHEKIITKLSDFDFSETANIAFVHTM